MKKSKDALKRFLNRTRGRARRGEDGDAKESNGASSNVPGREFPWRRLTPLALALLISSAVFAVLKGCQSKIDIPLLSPSRCETLTQDFGFLSTSAGVGFLALLTMEVLMIFAQLWSDKQVEAAERRAEIAERRAEIAEQARMEEAARAERARREESERAERAEQARREESERAERARREESERAERMRREEAERAERAERARREESERAERAEQARREEAERAERRERRLLELIKSLQKDEGEKDEDAS